MQVGMPWELFWCKEEGRYAIIMKIFHGAILNYRTYDKEICALVKDFKRWKKYLMGKDTIIHTDHQPLQYLQAQLKPQQTKNYKWMGFLQQFL